MGLEIIDLGYEMWVVGYWIYHPSLHPHPRSQNAHRYVISSIDLRNWVYNIATNFCTI